tara:strand:- start:426 stop:806 length:381 start_codon:yes stop_codon:yes gene_type:complete
LAGGLVVANGLLAKAHQMAGQLPALPVQQTMIKLARLGLIAVILLWVFSIRLGYLIYVGLAIGWAFHLQLLGATTLLGSISFLNVHFTLTRKVGAPPNPSVMKIIPIISRGTLVLVLLGSAIIMTG